MAKLLHPYCMVWAEIGDDGDGDVTMVRVASGPYWSLLNQVLTNFAS